MGLYRITIDLNSISYELEAENEDKAIEYAKECFTDETPHDIIKWANFHTHQYKNNSQDNVEYLDELVYSAEKLIQLTGGNNDNV